MVVASGGNDGPGAGLSLCTPEEARDPGKGTAEDGSFSDSTACGGDFWSFGSCYQVC